MILYSEKHADDIISTTADVTSTSSHFISLRFSENNLIKLLCVFLSLSICLSLAMLSWSVMLFSFIISIHVATAYLEGPKASSLFAAMPEGSCHEDNWGMCLYCV